MNFVYNLIDVAFKNYMIFGNWKHDLGRLCDQIIYMDALRTGNTNGLNHIDTKPYKV